MSSPANSQAEQLAFHLTGVHRDPFAICGSFERNLRQHEADHASLAAGGTGIVLHIEATWSFDEDWVERVLEKMEASR